MSKKVKIPLGTRKGKKMGQKGNLFAKEATREGPKQGRENGPSYEKRQVWVWEAMGSI